ncbi:MAG: hypothetical protein K2I48_00525 [Muribaculaceae bacterium]|nr:hypothetical protein [Muribaculaceae bacterium]
MRTIHFFNPETDYALASFAGNYSVPPRIVEVRRRLAATPLRIASKGDVVLLPDFDSSGDPPPQRLLADADDAGVSVITLRELRAFAHSTTPADCRILPWGWNPAAVRALRKWGFPPEALPSSDDLQRLRRLSHRNFTIEFNNLLNQELKRADFRSCHLSPLPEELDHADAAMSRIEAIGHAFVKAPWSSSGRGILCVTPASDPAKTRQWVAGTIRRQGSVMIETAAEKAIDFATEWYIADGSARFLGLSLFNASPQGRYQQNVDATQSELLTQIRAVAPDFTPDFIEAQSRVLSSLTRGYSGFAGIDMLADRSGAIRGCIEVNFRLTMGIVSLPDASKLIQECLHHRD